MTQPNPAAVQIGRSGGFDMYNSFLRPGLQPPQLKLQREDAKAGKLSDGTRHWLPTDDLPDDTWLSPGELLAPFRLHNMVEEQLKWFTARFPDSVIPRELLRDHLTEVISPQVLDQQSSYLGNRVAACQLGQQSLVFTCCGSAGHKVAMTLLHPQDGTMRCARRLSINTGKPVQQLALSRSSNSIQLTDPGSGIPAESEEQHMLLAARGPNQVAILHASFASSKRAWTLQLLATLRSEQAVRHVAWSPYILNQAAFICDDGSLHILAVSHTPTAPAGLSVEVHTVVQGGQAALKGEGASRMECAWVHPSRVACTAGRNLVHCQLGGWGQPARVVLLHSRPEGDDFLGLVRPSQGPGAAESSYLAASTRQHVLLFDTRHFNAPVLCWAHKMDSEPPQLLAFALSNLTPGDSGQAAAGGPGATPSRTMSQPWQGSTPWSSQAGTSSQHMASQADANYTASLSFLEQTGSQGRRDQAWPDTQASQGPDPLGQPPDGAPKVCGAIVASGLALGECKAFRFIVKPSGQCVTAQPPEEVVKKKSNRGPIKFRRRENWGVIEVKDATNQLTDGEVFAWRPSMANAVQSWNMPRTVCSPLKRMCDPTRGPPLLDLAAVHGDEEERMILQCPDLQGISLLPISHQQSEAGDEEQHQPSQQQQPDVMLVRSSFVGDLFLDPCFFFVALPDGHASQLRQQQSVPQQIPMGLPVTNGLERDSERQPTRAADGAKVHAPVAERQTEAKTGTHADLANGQAEGQSPKAGSADDGPETLAHGSQKAGAQAGPSLAPAFAADHTAEGQFRKGKGNRKASQRQDPGAHLGHGLQARAGQKGKDSPEKALPEDGSASMVKNIDIRQNLSKAEVTRRRHADPRWKTDRYEVMFDQKGLFQTDISVHHALFTAALRNYHSASQAATKGNMDSQTQHSNSDSAAQLWRSTMPGNEWGFQHMTDRVEAAQRAEAAVTAAESGFAISLPDLQAPTTIDELEARRRWEAANAGSQDAAFHPAVPGPRFRAPDAAAAVARALAIVTAAYRSLQAGEASSSTSDQAADFLAFGSAALAPAVQAACQEPAGDHSEPSLVFSGEKLIPLASWKGARLGPQLRSSQDSIGVASQLPDSQASVHLTQPSQARDTEGDSHRIPLVPADRVTGGGQLVCPVVPSHSWSGALLLPPAQQPSLALNNYHADLRPGQERDDIADLEALWLSSRGQQRAAASTPGVQANNAGGQQTPLGQQGPPRVQPMSNQTRRSAEHAVRVSGVLSGTARGDGVPAASPAEGIRDDFVVREAGSQPVNTGRNDAGPQSGRKSVQSATNEQGGLQLVNFTDAKRHRQGQQNESASRQTMSPDASSPAAGQIAATVPVVSPQSTLHSKRNAKRVKSRPSYVEGF